MRTWSHTLRYGTSVKTVGMKPLSERDENSTYQFLEMHALLLCVGMKPLSERDENLECDCLYDCLDIFG